MLTRFHIVVKGSLSELQTARLKKRTSVCLHVFKEIIALAHFVDLIERKYWIWASPGTCYSAKNI